MRSGATLRDPRLLAAGALLSGALLLATILGPTDPPALPQAAGGGSGEVTSQPDYGKLPLAFEPNAGRMASDVDFVARTGAGAAYLSDSGARLALNGAEPVELGLVGSLDSKPTTYGKLPGTVNDLRGDDSDKWETGIPTFQKVRYASVYPGVDLDWHGNADGRLEYDFMLAPGADPDRIALRLSGADSLRIAGNGDLLIGAGNRTLRQDAPRAFSQPAVKGGAWTPVDSRFELHGETVGFHLGRYDHARSLLIDPVVLDYSTYLGGNGADEANGIALDDGGAAYLTGRTTSTDFDTADPIEGDEVESDVFVSKLNPAGDAIEYSTYLGGNGGDRGSDIAVDATGATYVVGTTRSTDFNTMNELYGPRTDGAKEDAFLLKLSSDGDALLYSTYFGAASGGFLDGDGPGDEGLGVAVDASGAAYIAGNTNGLSQAGTAHNALPLVNSAASCPTEVPDGGVFTDPTEATDAFVAKFDPTQSGAASLIYSTCLGGDRGDGATDVAVDAAGSAYVTGTTNSRNFHQAGAIEPDQGGVDAFVTKLSPAGSQFVYSTYLGGADFDAGYGIAVDLVGAAYVTGTTSSSDFNTVNQIEGNSLGPDAFAAKLNGAGSALEYSTYLGGSGADAAHAIAVDSGGAAHLTGGTESPDFDLKGEIEDDSAVGDAFVSELTPAGGLACSTYLGGDGEDAGNAIATGAGSAYVAGLTGSSNFDIANQVEGDSAGLDAFVSKLNSSGPCAAGDAAPAAEPDQNLRVYVVVLDGLRPQEISPVLTPNLNALKEGGTWYEQARATMIAETLPNHAAMMTGAPGDRNGVIGNSFHARGFGFSKSYMSDPRLLDAETLTTTLEESCDVSTAVVQSKWYLWRLFSGEQSTPDDPFNQRLADYHWRPLDSPAFITKPDEHAPDANVMNEGFLPWFRSNPPLPLPHFAFLNLGDIDRSGHVDESGALTGGEASAFRQAALSDTDNLVGSWVQELVRTGAWDETVLIFTSDHGMDWSLPHNRVTPSGGSIVLNGGAAMVYTPAGADIAAVAETNAAKDGVEFVATKDGIGGFPSLEEVGLDDPNAGEVVLFSEPGWRFIIGDAENPVPGNHGHPLTQHSTLFVTGGHPAVDDESQSVGGEIVYQPDNRRVAPPAEGPGNLSIAPTVARLFGLEPPEGGYDADPLDDAFEDWAFDNHTPCGAPHERTPAPPPGSGGDDDGGPGPGGMGGDTKAAPKKKGCKRFKSKRKRRQCARKKRGVAR